MSAPGICALGAYTLWCAEGRAMDERPEDEELPDDDPRYDPPLPPIHCPAKIDGGWCFNGQCHEMGCVNAPLSEDMQGATDG